MTDREVEVLSHILEVLGSRKPDTGRRTRLSRPAVSILARTMPKAPRREDESEWLEYEQLLALCIEEDVILMAEDEIDMMLSLEADLRRDAAMEHEADQKWDRYMASGGAEMYGCTESRGTEIEVKRNRYRSDWARYTEHGDAETETD